MNQPTSEYGERRARLALEIARQRTELVVAYRNLEKPIHYAEVGLRGVSFLRQNQWIFMAAPTVVSLVFSIFGLRKGKAPRLPGAAREIPNPAEGKRGLLRSVAGRAYQAYQLYRRVRPFFP